MNDFFRTEVKMWNSEENSRNEENFFINNLRRVQVVQLKTRPFESPVKKREWSCEMPKHVTPIGSASLFAGIASLLLKTSRSSQKVPLMCHELALSCDEFEPRLKKSSKNHKKVQKYLEFRQGTSSRAQTRMAPSEWPESTIRGRSHSRPAGAPMHDTFSVWTDPKNK